MNYERLIEETRKATAVKTAEIRDEYENKKQVLREFRSIARTMTDNGIGDAFEFPGADPFSPSVAMSIGGAHIRFVCEEATKTYSPQTPLAYRVRVEATGKNPIYFTDSDDEEDQFATIRDLIAEFRARADHAGPDRYALPPMASAIG